MCDSESRTIITAPQPHHFVHPLQSTRQCATAVTNYTLVYGIRIGISIKYLTSALKYVTEVGGNKYFTRLQKHLSYTSPEITLHNKRPTDTSTRLISHMQQTQQIKKSNRCNSHNWSGITSFDYFFVQFSQLGRSFLFRYLQLRHTQCPAGTQFFPAWAFLNQYAAVLFLGGILLTSVQPIIDQKKIILFLTS